MGASCRVSVTGRQRAEPVQVNTPALWSWETPCSRQAEPRLPTATSSRVPGAVGSASSSQCAFRQRKPWLGVPDKTGVGLSGFCLFSFSNSHPHPSAGPASGMWHLGPAGSVAVLMGPLSSWPHSRKVRRTWGTGLMSQRTHRALVRNTGLAVTLSPGGQGRTALGRAALRSSWERSPLMPGPGIPPRKGPSETTALGEGGNVWVRAAAGSEASRGANFHTAAFSCTAWSPRAAGLQSLSQGFLTPTPPRL